jgi:hypothetical protein
VWAKPTTFGSSTAVRDEGRASCAKAAKGQNKASKAQYLIFFTESGIAF